MTATTQYHSDQIKFYKEDFQSLVDILLDRKEIPGYFNPIVVFLAEKTGYQVVAVNECFLFIQHFDRFSNMPFSKVLQNSTPDANFWWKLYNEYDENLIDKGCNKMLSLITDLV